MKTTTNTFIQGKLEIREKVCTLKEFIEVDRLKAGHFIFIGEVIVNDNLEITKNTQSFWVGDCTPFCGPSAKTGFQWDLNAPFMKKFVLEIHIYRLV